MSIIKKIVASIALLFFVVIVMRLIFSASDAHHPQEIAYAAFSQALEDGKLQHATIFMGSDSADMELTGRDSSKQYVHAVPTDDLPNLIKRMLDRGVIFEFSKARQFRWADFVLDTAPLLLLIIFATYIFLFRRGKRV